MPRGIMKKIDLEAKLYKMKTELYDGTRGDKSGDWHDGAHEMISTMLDYIREWRTNE